MIKVQIKPLSVNECWQGKRFKTDSYKVYERSVLFLLPKLKIPDSPFKINIEIGFSNSGADTDNPIKPILDILQKKYGINDKDIFELNIKKMVVTKKEEYFKFQISSL